MNQVFRNPLSSENWIPERNSLSDIFPLDHQQEVCLNHKGTCVKDLGFVDVTYLLSDRICSIFAKLASLTFRLHHRFAASLMELIVATLGGEIVYGIFCKFVCPIITKICDVEGEDPSVGSEKL